MNLQFFFDVVILALYFHLAYVVKRALRYQLKFLDELATFSERVRSELVAIVDDAQRDNRR